jgi:hypothetical protein
LGSSLKESALDNGLVLTVTDESSNYYADFWNLKIVIRAMVRVDPAYLRAINPSQPSELAAKEAIGEEVPYYRELTRIGVREREKEATLRQLLASFEENSLPYLNHPSFPERMVRSHWKKLVDEIKREETKEG